MALEMPSTVFGEDVYMLTAAGEKQLRDAETSLKSPELELLIHIDGVSTVAELEARTRLSLSGTFGRAFDQLLRRNMVKLRDEYNALDFVEFFNNRAPPPTAAAISEATAEASDGTSTLQKHGYYVRIARRAADKPETPGDHALSILVIEDEPHLVKFLRQFLTLEGFQTRVATNRAEIIRELSATPRPDLVLLDVILPDADGFEILVKMRQHPALRAVPVVMLTAKATRDSVLKGLSGGADGYITKPFEAEVLVKAARTVLGMPRTGVAPL